MVSEYFNKNRDAFIETDKDLMLNHKFFSAAAINPCIEHNSSPRGLMMSSHISQALVLDDSRENILQTGLEVEFGKYTISKKLKTASEIISVIKRYQTMNSKQDVSEYIVIYRELETGTVNSMSIPYSNRYHPYFGFKFNVNENINTFVRGTILDKDTYLAKTPSIKENGGYALGRDVNICNMTMPNNDEDGFIVSKSFCENFKFKLFETKTIDVGEDSFLLNLYGDDDNYKPFPDIGEYINSTGAVFASRAYSDKFGPILYGKGSVKKFDPNFDRAVYTRGPGGKVIDVKVYRNNRKKKMLPTNTDVQCEKYATALVSFHKQIINVYESINKEYYKTFGRDLEVGPNFNTLLVESYGIVESDKPKTKLKKMYRKETLDIYRIEITIEYEVTPTIGFKPTDLSGGKGTIVDIWDDKDMPIDADGNRADLIVDPKSTIGRLNVGRLYERYIKAGSRKAKKLAIEELHKFNFVEINNATDDAVIDVFRIVTEFTDIVDNEMSKTYASLLTTRDIDKMRIILHEVINEELYLYLTVDNDKRKYEIIEDIKLSKFAPPYGLVTFNYNGEVKHTKNNVLIAPMYIMLLSKIADTTLATSSAKLNHFGIPVVVTKADRDSMPHRNSPTRTIGETEGRIMAAYGGRKFIAELKDRNTSLNTHIAVYNNILTNRTPTNVEQNVNRRVIKYGGDRALEILESLWNSIGMELKYVKDKNRFIEHTDEEYVVTIDDIENLSEVEDIGSRDDE